MFQKILIANRGEIACRVAATARRLGVKTVAVYSDADAHARHVHACDEAVALGGLAPRDSYLLWQRILAAAQATGAQAIHPGYGFLSENAAFAQACADAGIVFIGPPPQAMAAMGSKSAAKALMDKAGVPLVPGYHGQDNSLDTLQREADRIGYPVLIKASAGGGGKGMRRVDLASEFAAALASCQREAQASFGDSHVLVERYVTRPRHIEIQVFADTHGHCIHLNERDCSVQRRHQKVLEESPAPGLSAEQRAQMGAAAVAAAQAVGYVGAGTVEFIVEQPAAAMSNVPGVATGTLGSMRFYFMEMNTRLQVEHPVTEAVTGLDLVEWQLRVASGEALGMTQADVPLRGHAIEARICAENPDANFMPAIGTMEVARWPAHVAFSRNADGELLHDAAPVRIDRGFDEGDSITPHYDSMIAKLIVWGSDRAQALASLDVALAHTHIVGLHTNVAFLRRVLSSRAFSTADLDTALIEREHAALFEAPGLPLPLIAAAVVAHVQRQELAPTLTHLAPNLALSPWAARDGWRLHGAALRHVVMDVPTHDGVQRHTVAVHRHHVIGTSLVVDNLTHQMDAHPVGEHAHDISLLSDVPNTTPRSLRATVTVHGHGPRLALFTAAGSVVVQLVDASAPQAQAAGSGSLAAPMPGKVLAIHVKAGDTVQAGQALAVMEAMKMEHTLNAPRAGVVAEVLFAAGDAVPEGAALIRLQELAAKTPAAATA
jgi:3-methylcrotonyl-CoA carboxylase alpha subunit